MAQTANSDQTSGVSNFQKEAEKNSAKAVKTTIGVQSFNYANSYDSQNAEQNPYQENDLHLDIQVFKAINKYEVFGQALFDHDMNREKNAAFAIPTLGVNYYFAEGNKTFTELSIGRTIHYTSRIDQDLHLGLIHPYYTMDELNYTTQGLTGFEFIQEEKNFGFLIGYYPLFLPNQSPSVNFNNGQTISQNRWSKQPPKLFLFNGQEKAIDYQIDNYNESQVMNHGTVRLDLKGKLDTSELTLGYKRGPLDDIPLSRETYANLDVVGQVKLGPDVTYSSQYTADAKFDFSKANLYFSYIKDIPDHLTAPVGRSVQTLSDLEIRGVTLESKPVVVSGLDQTFYITYAVLSNGLITDLNSDGSENIFTFSKYRQQYFHPLKVGAKNSFYFLLAHPVQTNLEYTYDATQKGSILSAQSTYALGSFYGGDLVKVSVGFDILGSAYNADDYSDYFISHYQANDRVYGGVQYVF